MSDKNGKKKPKSEPLSPERHVTERWTVEVSGFGKPDKLRYEQALTISEALHHEFGAGKVRLIDSTGKEWKYDHLAHDGHHFGHETVLEVTDAGEA